MTQPGRDNAKATSRRGKTLERPWTSAEWVEYFRLNAAHKALIPWEAGAEVTEAELAVIGRSLQSWQLGESSDGAHLRYLAARHGERIGDPDYAVTIDLFIREEQGHGELLGRFLDLAGQGRLARDWGVMLFQIARKCVLHMEAWTTPVVMAETLAMVYYNAIRRATRSRVLRAICGRLLADEGPHLRFQAERLAAMRRQRSALGRWLTGVGQRLLFLVVVLLVWFGHRKALRAGGYRWRHYWKAAWDRMNGVWRLMDPRRYDWTTQPRAEPIPARCCEPSLLDFRDGPILR